MGKKPSTRRILYEMPRHGMYGINARQFEHERELYEISHERLKQKDVHIENTEKNVSEN